jgi:uncharacterized glyoxalase superfamily protein PhnB
MKTNRSMPAATVIPVLHYPDVDAAAEWLCAAFGFSARLRIGDHRVQLNAGDACVVVARGAVGSPDGTSIMVRVADVNAHHVGALAHGAQVTGEPEDFPYGERQYSVKDFAGRTWTFSETLFDSDPADWGGALVGN